MGLRARSPRGGGRKRLTPGEDLALRPLQLRGLLCSPSPWARAPPHPSLLGASPAGIGLQVGVEPAGGRPRLGQGARAELGILMATHSDPA